MNGFLGGASSWGRLAALLCVVVGSSSCLYFQDKDPIEMGEGDVTGVVTGVPPGSSGVQALEGVRVTLPGSSLVRSSGGNGRFVLRNLPVGTHGILLSLDNNRDGQPDLTSMVRASIRETGNPKKRVHVDLGTILLAAPGRLEGTVGGAPDLSTVRVAALLPSADQDVADGDVAGSAQVVVPVDNAGRFSLTGLAAGRWVVVAFAPGLMSRAINRDAVAGNAVDVGTLPLVDATGMGTLQGTVVQAPDNTQLAGAGLQALTFTPVITVKFTDLATGTTFERERALSDDEQKQSTVDLSLIIPAGTYAVRVTPCDGCSEIVLPLVLVPGGGTSLMGTLVASLRPAELMDLDGDGLKSSLDKDGPCRICQTAGTLPRSCDDGSGNGANLDCDDDGDGQADLDEKFGRGTVEPCHCGAVAAAPLNDTCENDPSRADKNHDGVCDNSIGCTGPHCGASSSSGTRSSSAPASSSGVTPSSSAAASSAGASSSASGPAPSSSMMVVQSSSSVPPSSVDTASSSGMAPSSSGVAPSSSAGAPSSSSATKDWLINNGGTVAPFYASTLGVVITSQQHRLGVLFQTSDVFQLDTSGPCAGLLSPSIIAGAESTVTVLAFFDDAGACTQRFIFGGRNSSALSAKLVARPLDDDVVLALMAQGKLEVDGPAGQQVLTGNATEGTVFLVLVKADGTLGANQVVLPIHGNGTLSNGAITVLEAGQTGLIYELGDYALTDTVQLPGRPAYQPRMGVPATAVVLADMATGTVPNAEVMEQVNGPYAVAEVGGSLGVMGFAGQFGAYFSFADLSTPGPLQGDGHVWLGRLPTTPTPPSLDLLGVQAQDLLGSSLQGVWSLSFNHNGGTNIVLAMCTTGKTLLAGSGAMTVEGFSEDALLTVRLDTLSPGSYTLMDGSAVSGQGFPGHPSSTTSGLFNCRSAEVDKGLAITLFAAGAFGVTVGRWDDAAMPGFFELGEALALVDGASSAYNSYAVRLDGVSARLFGGASFVDSGASSPPDIVAALPDPRIPGGLRVVAHRDGPASLPGLRLRCPGGTDPGPAPQTFATPGSAIFTATVPDSSVAFACQLQTGLEVLSEGSALQVTDIYQTTTVPTSLCTTVTAGQQSMLPNRFDVRVDSGATQPAVPLQVSAVTRDVNSNVLTQRFSPGLLGNPSQFSLEVGVGEYAEVCTGGMGGLPAGVANLTVYAFKQPSQDTCANGKVLDTSGGPGTFRQESLWDYATAWDHVSNACEEFASADQYFWLGAGLMGATYEIRAATMTGQPYGINVLPISQSTPECDMALAVSDTSGCTNTGKVDVSLTPEEQRLVELFQPAGTPRGELALRVRETPPLQTGADTCSAADTPIVLPPMGSNVLQGDLTGATNNYSEMDVPGCLLASGPEVTHVFEIPGGTQVSFDVEFEDKAALPVLSVLSQCPSAPGTTTCVDASNATTWFGPAVRFANPGRNTLQVVVVVGSSMPATNPRYTLSWTSWDPNAG